MNWFTDLNVNERITKFQNQVKHEFVFRIPLHYFTDIGKINFPLKIDFRIKCHLEADIKKLFEFKTTVGAHQTQKLYLQRYRFFSTNNFWQIKVIRLYMETIMGSKKN